MNITADLTTQERTPWWEKKYRVSRADQRDWNNATRVYVSVADETTLENLSNRHGHPWRELKPLVRNLLKTQYGYEGKVRWSQRAGCSCPCSPGFILDTRLRNNNPLDAWLTYKVTA